MKNVLTSLFILCTIHVYSQTPIPCEFSWSSAITNTGTFNYVTSTRSQPYQGPCLAFAFNAAIETKYAIENRISNPILELSDAYLDYKVWGINDYEGTLENGFKIPILAYGINNFPPFCTNEIDCHYLSDVRKCINNSSGQKSYTFVVTGDDFNQNTEVICNGAINNFVTVDMVEQLTLINSEDEIKDKILKNGPIILRVNGLNNAKKFRNYNTPTSYISYHAFTIMGWDANSKWIIKDSWPGMSGLVSTKQNINILQMLNEGSIELYQVSGIRFNGSSPSSNPVNLQLNPCEQTLTLSGISVNLNVATIGGYLYSKFWVSSNISVDKWVWGIDYPNRAIKRSQIDTPTTSSILLSPVNSGTVTVFVNGFKNGKKVTAEKRIYLSNGNTGGLY